MNYTYDVVGSRRSISSTANGNTDYSASYSYDDAGRLQTVTDAGGGVTTYFYDARHRITRQNQPNGMYATYQYDGRDRVTYIEYVLPEPMRVVVGFFDYDYDAAGNRTSAHEFMIGGTEAYLHWTYDATNRLTSETQTDSAQNPVFATRYQYDPADNRTSMTTNGHETTYSYNVLDQLTTSTFDGATITFSYDGRGNRSGVNDGAGYTASYSYDALDRLLTVSTQDAANPLDIQTTSAQFGYDSDGRRVSTTFDGITRQQVWDETSAYGDVILELDGNGAPVNGYTLSGNRIVAQTDANHAASYFLQDALGSTRGLTSGSTVTQAYSYDAFGSLLGDVGSLATNYLFAGQQYDSATGLYSMRARYYDPGVGRFLSRDTWAINYANPVELNRYAYAANNPVRWNDPSGNNFIETIGLHFKNNATRYIGALNGGLLGSLVGRLGAVAMYSAIMNNICGSKMRDELVSRQISSLDYMNQAANAGAFMGAWLGFAPETRGLIAGAGVAFSALAFADDPNACTLAQMLLAMAGGMSGKLTLGGGLELVVSNSGAAALTPATSTLAIQMPAEILAGVVSNGILEWVNFSQDGSGGTGGSGQNDDLTADKGLQTTPREVYAAGNNSNPRAPRNQDVPGGMNEPPEALPYTGDEPQGASTFNTVDQLRGVGLSGRIWRLPEGSNLGDLRIIADGGDVGGPRGLGHHTIYPSRPMTFQEFRDLFSQLPWEDTGERLR